jgi:tRNA pseudouridine55 synthase
MSKGGSAPDPGIVVVDKPAGMTSHDVVGRCRRIFATRRVGHAGTLDPMATGVLVVCLGWATRLVTFVQERPKTYSARFLLGRRSNTDDVTGDVVETADVVAPTRERVEELLPMFVGTIQQVPPQFSAVHVDGQRAHKMARRGKTVDIEPRPVDVHRITLVDYTYPQLDVDVECGSGTYIRSIGRDLGNALGCGAVMSGLVRQSIGEFTLETAQTLDSLTAVNIADRLLPPLCAVSHLARFVCTTADREELSRGRAVGFTPPANWAVGQPVAIVDAAENLLALAEYDEGRQALQPRQVFAADS